MRKKRLVFMKTLFPNYNNGLTNVTNAILKYFDCESYHEPLKELEEVLSGQDYKNIILILYDGMGSNLLAKHLEENSFLRKQKIKDIHSVFPATTTAATTSVLSGLNPNEHGWLGWDLYFKEEDKIVTMFLNTLKDSEIKASDVNLAQKYYPYTSIIERINQKYKAYQLMPFREKAFHSLEEMNERILNYSKEEGKKFIYAYYDEPDHTLHEVGTDAPKIKELFQTINDSTEKLCGELEESLVIIIADHGHINCEAITLSEYEDLFSLLERDISIEGRACNFFIKTGKQEEFVTLFHQYFKEDFLLYSKEQVKKEKLFGTGKEHLKFDGSLGDFLALAITNKYFRYNENSIDLKSMHAGMTEDEILVPFILYDCKKKYKLIALDLDDTLLNSNHEVTPETKAALLKCKEKGIFIIGVTARTLQSALDVVPKELFDYLILNNGATLYDNKNEKIKMIGKITKEETTYLIKKYENLVTQIDFVGANNYYIYKNKKNSPLSFLIDVESVEEVTEEIARMNVFFKDEENVFKVEEELKKEYPKLNVFVMQATNTNSWLVINPKGINKRTVLEELGKKLEIEMEEMIFFGDGLNDLPLMDSPVYSVAMGNALDVVKEHANEVTLSNNEDGISRVLLKKF